jgi:hypothetical protein
MKHLSNYSKLTFKDKLVNGGVLNSSIQLNQDNVHLRTEEKMDLVISVESQSINSFLDSTTAIMQKSIVITAAAWVVIEAANL